MITRREGVLQMGVRTAVLALFIGFFLMITKLSTQGTICLEPQAAGFPPIPAPGSISTFSKSVSVIDYGLQINLREILPE